LIEDYRIMLNSWQLWRVNHVRREANRVTHRLANEAFSLMDEQVHMEEGPLCILEIEIAECNNL
jgi:cytochrome oxidase assembly protein ShyY1